MLQPSTIEAFNKVRPAGPGTVLCHAPFKSIYFAMGGKLITCCLNRMYTLGTYPQQSIKDIWLGEKANELREAIKQNDLSKGCQICGHLLTAGNFEGIAIRNFDYVGWNAQGYPTKMDFELDNTCNLECVMCRGELSSSIRQNREKRPPLRSPYDAEFVRQLEEFIPHLENSHFLGGEPFLIPIYFDLWEKMLEINPRIQISVQTNATVVNERVKRVLDGLPVSIAVSIDSIEKETYESIRVNAKFERVMENIRFFRAHCAAKGTQFTISYCPMIYNWRELPRVVEFCNALDAEVFFNTVTLPVHSSLSYFSASQLAEVAAFLTSDHNLPANTQTEQRNKKALRGVADQIQYWQQLAEKREQTLNGQQITTMPELYRVLREYVKRSPDKTEAEKNLITLDIEEKIDYMLQCAEEEGQLEQTQLYLYSIDPTLICDFFPTNEKEHMYSMLKTHAGLV